MVGPTVALIDEILMPKFSSVCLIRFWFSLCSYMLIGLSLRSYFLSKSSDGK